MKYRRVKSLRNNRRGISPDHRQHGHVTEKNHKFRARIRKDIKTKIEQLEFEELMQEHYERGN